MKRKYNTAEELQTAIDSYFNLIDSESKQAQYKKATFSGLAYHLGFSQRQSLNQYAELDDEDLSIPIKRAMLLIECHYETGLDKPSCAGSIFALKNRGWKDKQEHEHTISDDAYKKLESLYKK